MGLHIFLSAIDRYISEKLRDGPSYTPYLSTEDFVLRTESAFYVAQDSYLIYEWFQFDGDESLY